MCYPCSFYFHALMPVVLWERKLPPFNDTEKDYKLITDFDKVLTFSVAMGLDFVLSLGVTSPLLIPVIGISCPVSFRKDCFDMLKSIGFRDLFGLLSSLRRSDRVYFG